MTAISSRCGPGPNLSELPSPAAQWTKTFATQSYFDSTKQQKAIMAQPPNSPIVPSTIQHAQVNCYGVALHPLSETPVAVQFTGGASGVYVLKPGETLKPRGPRAGAYVGFDWGLPFGWLGGGFAHLIALASPDADVLFPDAGGTEVIFHRMRQQILADQNPPIPAAATANWPSHFPWANAYRQDAAANNIAQKGAPIITVTPTRTLLRLRIANLGAPASMRIVWGSTDDFDLGADDGVTLTTNEYSTYDVQWPANFNQSGVAATSQGYPTIYLNGPELNIGGDNAILQLLDISTAGALVGTFCDIIRYGKI